MYVHQVNLPVYHYTDVEQSHLENILGKVKMCQRLWELKGKEQRK